MMLYKILKDRKRRCKETVPNSKKNPVDGSGFERTVACNLPFKEEKTKQFCNLKIILIRSQD